MNIQMSELWFLFAAEATHRLLLQTKEVPHQQLQDDWSLAAACAEGKRDSDGCKIFKNLWPRFGCNQYNTCCG